MTGEGFMNKKSINLFLKEWKWVVISLTAALVIFFVSRIFHLTIIPVFVDEAIYIRWAQVMRAEVTLRFLPLSDGKQPLFMWMIIPFLKLFHDPLFAGRMLSVFSGFASLIGLFVISLILTKNKIIAGLSAFFYLILPYSFFFDRMALVDSLLSAFGIWVMLFAVLLVKKPQLDLAMILGLLLGGAFLTKSPAIFFAGLIPLALLFNDRKPEQWYLIRYFGLLIVVYIFALGVYNILRLGPNFQMVAIRNKDYVFGLKEILSRPFHPFIERWKEIILWNLNLMTWPIFLLSIAGIIWRVKKNFRTGLWLLCWWFLPLLIQSQMARVFTSRYILFTIPPLIIFTAWFLFDIFAKKRVGLWVSLAALSLLPIAYISRLSFNPQTAPLTREMRFGYLEEWTAGYGVKESAEILKEKTKTASVFVGTEGYFGTLPDGLQMYLEGVPNIRVVGVGWPIKEISNSLRNSIVDNEVYLVVNSTRLEIVPGVNNLTLLAEYPKAIRPDGSQEKLLLFRFNGEKK